MRTCTPVICLWTYITCMLAALMFPVDQGHAGESSNATDYAVAAHWLALPAATNKAVDIFYFYPTAWTSTNPNPEVCSINNQSMLQQAPPAFARQATAFEPIGNIYAPFYRQANLTAMAPAIVAGIPTTDGMAAFDYYIRHFNQGRPFIMAGHSQGANVLNNLLARYMQTNSAVLARMIAAYVIGYPVTARYLADNPHLKFATGPGDTGGIISYNTQAPGVSPATNLILWGLKGIVINPLTWTRTETPAGTNQGCGSYMPNSNGVFERTAQYADARVDSSNGVLICSTADTNVLAKFSPFARVGVFHSFDYSFYYFNLRVNAAQRTRNFLQKTGADYDADGRADPAVYDAGSGALGVFLSGNNYTVLATTMNQPSAFNLQPMTGDFDGDCLADPAVYDPIAAQLLVRLSSQAYTFNAMAIGDASCAPVNGDFDGDSKADPALYSSATGQMGVWFSGSGYTPFTVPMGGAECANASADYDGDGLTDPAVYHAPGGILSVLLSSQSYTPAQFSLALSTSGVQPAPGDYDGDGKADPAIFQPLTGLWLIALSGQNYTPAIFNSIAGATLLSRPADYDNDGKTDPAVYDIGLRAYCVWQSGSGYIPAILQW